ncbi:MAG: hypothetical protein CM1200mP2_00810 [Planctomycetaceae bacterium]|nr:MAG: hypothetical protein CM1200mP2_00810 [Planctomycetaceae bacterium]
MPFLDSHSSDFVETAFARSPTSSSLVPSWLEAKAPTPASSPKTHCRGAVDRPGVPPGTDPQEQPVSQTPGYQQALQEVGLRVANQELTGSPNSQNGTGHTGPDRRDRSHGHSLRPTRDWQRCPTMPTVSWSWGIAYACLDDIESAFPRGRSQFPLGQAAILRVDPRTQPGHRARPPTRRSAVHPLPAVPATNRPGPRPRLVENFDELTPFPTEPARNRSNWGRREVDDPLQELISEVEGIKKEIDQRFHPEKRQRTAQPTRTRDAADPGGPTPGPGSSSAPPLKLVNEDAQLAAPPGCSPAQGTMDDGSPGNFLDETTAMTLDEMFQELGEQGDRGASRTTLASAAGLRRLRTGQPVVAR